MLYSKTGNNIIKCLIRNIRRKMIFIGFLDEIEGRCLRRDPGLGTWDTDRAGIAGSRGRNRVLGAAFMRTTCRRNARIMNKEKERARRFYNNMSRSQRTTTKKNKNQTKLQNDTQYMNTTQTPHFCGYTWTYTPQHGRAPGGKASSAVAAVCRRQGREQKRRSRMAGRSLWDETVEFSPLLFHILCYLFQWELIFLFIKKKRKGQKLGEEVFSKPLGAWAERVYGRASGTARGAKGTSCFLDNVSAGGQGPEVTCKGKYWSGAGGRNVQKPQ